MWRFLRRLFPPSPTAPTIYRVVDFTKPIEGHWAAYEGGDNFDARFIVCGKVCRNDEILIRLKSGRIGRYHLFSVLPDFSGVANWRVRACILGYYGEATSPRSKVVKIKGLLADGSRWLQPHTSEPIALPSSSLESTSEQGDLLTWDEAYGEWADSLRSGNNL